MKSTLTSRRWVGRLLVGCSVAAVLGVQASAGVASAATPAGPAPSAAAGALPGQTGPGGDDTGSGGGDTGGGDTGGGDTGGDTGGGTGGGDTGGGDTGGGDTGGGDTGGGTGGGDTGGGVDDGTGGGVDDGLGSGDSVDNTPPPETDPPGTVPDPAAQAAQDAAEAAAERAQQEAEDRAEAARDAAEDAAEARRERAEAAQQVRGTWDSHDRPNKMVVVRSNRIDVVDKGSLISQTARSGGAVTINTLDRALPSSWVELNNGTATLAATVVLTPGTKMDVGGDVKTLNLYGGAGRPDAASIYTGGGDLSLTGVTVGSFDPGPKQPLPANAVGRPNIVVSKGGSLETTDATINDMGAAPSGADDGSAAVLFNPGSTGSLVRTTVARSSTGIELSRSNDVRLEDVTISESGTDGLILRGDTGTTLAGVRAEKNGANGVSVTGEVSPRPITGISTSGNRAYGVAIVGQTGTRINGVTTEADRAGGLRLSRSSDVVVTDYTATDQPIGVFTHVNTTGVVLDGVHTTGGRRGVVIEKSTTKLEVKNSTFESPRVAGVAIGGKEITLNAVEIDDGRSAVRVERGSGQITLNGLTLNGGQDGIVATPGTADLVVRDLTANHVEYDALRTFSSGAQIIGGKINGGSTGLDLNAATTVSGTVINASEEGIHSRSPEPILADSVTIDALDLGINNLQGPFTLSGSRVHALEAVRGQINQQGQNDLSLPPLNLLSAIGVPLVLLALVLEQIHAFRQRRFQRGRVRHEPPPLPVSVGG